MRPGLAPRQGAADAYEAVASGHTTLADALSVAAPSLTAADAALLRAIVRTSVRRRGDIEWVLSQLMTRPLPQRAATVRAVMATAAAQLLFMRQADHAAVDCAVDLLKGNAATAGFAKLANAVLRRLVREREALLPAIPVGANTPPFLWRRWVAAYGESAAAGIAAAHREEPPLDLALAPGRHATAALPGEGVPLPGGGMRLPAQRVDAIDGFSDGAWWVQDFAAQLPVTLLGDVAGKRVADLCAAPGGKTMQLAAAGAEVVAVEQSAERAALIDENLARTRLADRVEVRVDDARAVTGRFDAVLLDAPCSATGTLRRHPDVAFAKREEDFGSLAALQQALFHHAARLLVPGGTLVFATCSLEREEGEDHLAQLPDGLRLDPLRENDGAAFAFRTAEGAMRTRPDQALPDADPRADADGPDGFAIDTGAHGLRGLDGFFAARFVKL